MQSDCRQRTERVLLVRGLPWSPDKERALLVLNEVADQPVEVIAEIMNLGSIAVTRGSFLRGKSSEPVLRQRKIRGATRYI